MLSCPSPILFPANLPIASSVSLAVEHLQQQRYVWLQGNFHLGLQILNKLEEVLGKPDPSASFSKRDAHKQKFRKRAQYLLVQIKDHQISLQQAGECGFLQEMYPTHTDFFLSFVDTQELIGAWKQYSTGIHFAVLGHKLHPFLRTYIPTRTSHLELFATWLSQYKGSTQHVLDIGTGSGILSCMLAKKGFPHIICTDNNPNAIESLQREKQRHTYLQALETIECDLLQHPRFVDYQADLIVCNPPWIPGTAHSDVDQALYFAPDFFAQFFDQVHKVLHANGTLVLIFSNIMTLLLPHIPHPFQTELEKNRFVLTQKMQRKVQTDKNAHKTRTTKENVELWVLQPIKNNENSI